MLLSSTHMVILLFRHQRHSQLLHSTSFSLRVSPEKRATQTNLLLVTFFMVMHWVDLIISSSSVLHNQMLVSNAYATVSPSVLISSDKRIINILQYVN